MGALYILDGNLTKTIETSLGWKCKSKHNLGSHKTEQLLRSSATASGLERLRRQNRLDVELVMVGQRFAKLDAFVFRHPTFVSEVAASRCQQKKCGLLCQ